MLLKAPIGKRQYTVRYTVAQIGPDDGTEQVSETTICISTLTFIVHEVFSIFTYPTHQAPEQDCT
jgi:hypothetical protein